MTRGTMKPSSWANYKNKMDTEKSLIEGVKEAEHDNEAGPSAAPKPVRPLQIYVA